MVIIHFDDHDTEKRALDFLIGRYSFKTWTNGDLMLPEPAVGQLAAEGISFRVKGPATYEHFVPTLRDSLPRRYNEGQRVPNRLLTENSLSYEIDLALLPAKRRRFAANGNSKGKFTRMSWFESLWMSKICPKIASSFWTSSNVSKRVFSS